jgi:hypothetical protein
MTIKIVTSNPIPAYFKARLIYLPRLGAGVGRGGFLPHPNKQRGLVQLYQVDVRNQFLQYHALRKFRRGFLLFIQS